MRRHYGIAFVSKTGSLGPFLKVLRKKCAAFDGLSAWAFIRRWELYRINKLCFRVHQLLNIPSIN